MQRSDAKLRWQQQTQPYSERFGDIYFSSQNGLAESDYVFLQHNHLAARFQKLSPGSCFCIGETGFGTGLNFLAAWRLWQKHRAPGARLHFVSAEKYPLTKAQIDRALGRWPELSNLKEALLRAYPLMFYPGQMHLPLSEDVSLSLLIGDAACQFRRFEGKVDAWFLDGFSPAKNPEMWQEALFIEIFRLSYHATTLATFTAASSVRKGLQKAGFQIIKVKGFSHKREMITAFISAQKNTESKLPKYLSLPRLKPASVTEPVAVIGAGMSGVSIAYALNQFGIKVDLYDQNASFAKGASGNPYGILKPYLTQDMNVADQFYTQGFLYAKAFIEAHQHEVDVKASGALEILSDLNSQKRYQALFQKRVIDSGLASLVDAEKASAIAGVAVKFPCVYYPSALMVNPRSLCACLLSHAKDTNVFYQHQLRHCRQHQRQWELLFLSQNQRVVKAYRQVVFAGSIDLINTLDVLKLIEAYASVGQISIMQASCHSRCILIDKGYVLPPAGNCQMIGASFRKNSDLCRRLRDSDHQFNIRQVENIWPFLADNVLSGQVAPRCVTSDHLPLVGPLADIESYHQQYRQALQKGGRLKHLAPVDYLIGLYLASGFGSKGLSTMFITARLIAGLISGHQNLTCPSDVFKAVHPLRFQVRDLKRRSGCSVFSG